MGRDGPKSDSKETKKQLPCHRETCTGERMHMFEALIS